MGLTVIRHKLEVARRDALEQRIFGPVDLDRELRRASRYGYRRHRDGQVRRVRLERAELGSFLTGTSAELIYSNPTFSATAIASFTTETILNTTANMGPYPVTPPFFFLPGYIQPRTIRLVVRGVYSMTSSPTMQMFLRFNSGTPASPPTGPNVMSMTTTLALGNPTAGGFEIEGDVQMQTMAAAGANSTLRGMGMGTFLTTPSTASLSLPFFAGASNTAPTVATFDISATNYISFSASCSTSATGNSVAPYQLFVFGLN